MSVTFRIRRYDASTNGTADYHSYEVDLPPNATVLDGLLHIREEMDGTVGFRGNCLRGICGDCTVRANGSGVLACLAKAESIATKDKREITLEPLRHIGVIKDLVYDWDSFLWQKMGSLEPWLKPDEVPAHGEYVVPAETMEDLQKVMSCMWCGLCDEGCTVIPVDKVFKGPAALTKAYRFVADPRDGAERERLKLLDEKNGLWDCVHCFEANEHCPKGIEPTDRIIDMRDRSTKYGVTNSAVARHNQSFANSVKASGWLDEGRLAVESEGWFNIPGLLRLAPVAIRAILRRKAPLPFLHHKRPGAEHIRRIFEKVETEK